MEDKIMKKLLAMNGAVLSPSCLKIRQSPAARKLFPAFDIVPWIMITFANLIPP